MRVIVGVSGGIAAYKAVSVVREFVRRGHNVTVIPTGSALRFVGLPTWEAISRNSVPTDLFEGVAEVRHVALGQQADLVVVAPTTANMLASLASGFAADLLGTTVLASTAPLVLAPAMHTEMWENAAVQANVESLRRRGTFFIGPESGALTGDDSGVGRMSEPETIVDFALSCLTPQSLEGKRVLISAGGTREPLDPVRYLGNRSTGAMGVALAGEARLRGAQVTLVHAHLEVSPPSGVELVSVSTAEEMHAAMVALQPAHDLVIMAAAVADWRAKNPSTQKLRKADQPEHWSPELERTPDIVADLGQRKPTGQVLIGFAAETEDIASEREAAARMKLDTKKTDAVVLNLVGERVGFGEVETAVTLITASPQSLTFEGTKSSVAGRLLDALPEL
ncbi:MAG: bifunctional phosphopantothenoylcysteine decarboxylase/phosphopantothenate--cysteine ligase CoaBC [Pontimonas sp.]|nr:bifunctional phosphopantothenoylcysteine decarboxylase/phosphopantothenate--cysteine ligase CoaBC [Pontimonas sp.]